MQLELLPCLSSEFSKLLKNPYNYDIIIKINEKEFKVHSIILYARSNYFKILLSQGRIINEFNIMCLELSEVDPEVFEMIIKYIYTGIIDFSNATSEKIFSFLITSSKLNLTEATSYTQSYLVDNEKKWIHENFSKVLNNIFKLENCKKFQNYCIKRVCFEAKSFFSSKDSLNLKKNIINLILDLDNLYIEEIDLWDFLIEWGMNQLHKIHDNKISIFIINDNDYEENQKNHKLINNINKEIMNQQHKSPKWKIREALKKILDPLIYRIRFREINSDDFHEKVKPYKMIIPMEVYEDIMSYYLIGSTTKINMPSIPRRGNINSLIINSKHMSILSSWIDKKDLENNNLITKINQYEFKLLFRATFLNDFNTKKFHKYCDNNGPCIVIIKIKDSNKIIGGYNPIGWCISNSWIHSNDSFIFSFDDDLDLSKRRISRILGNGKYSIYDCEDFNLLLNFGNGDLILDGTIGICDKSNYEFCILNSDERSFEAEQLEVFSVRLTD
ncbi:hypothetical protein RclHR1_00330046 [Rhizophagus clarus]|uniref:BTB domain-containing protein n=1 Tax=Rhizophagus clarus TaxID=94130 RepID=A0A2Z6RNK4_9GLOM|nr:hypothetical protein RclHR1_00330046 [Rhizophagus clarus]GES81710.1 hypothetical protein GLOIN_2v1871651 [Rhizophagus clarus]